MFLAKSQGFKDVQSTNSGVANCVSFQVLWLLVISNQEQNMMNFKILVKTGFPC